MQDKLRENIEKDQYTLLNEINSADDLRGMSPQILEDVANECRHLIINTVAQKGGHLASNLGVVELTLALHYCFDTPNDRLIWDVGHQIYTHKIITGRRDQFRQGLRSYKGLAGFPKKSESSHDHCDTGHSGTSISFAVGMAQALLTQSKNNRVIVIIGDGSTTAGMVFEALNQGGLLRNPNLIVILNDNEMSISPNVGGLAEYISRRMISRRPAQMRRMIKSLLNSIPKAGSDLIRVVQKIERSLKDLIQPGLLFEELGFQYLGPFDGHKIEGLIELFDNIKRIPGPLLVHVLTRKGCGYQPAEIEPERFHGAPAFDIGSGVFKKSEGPPSYTSVFGDAVVDLAKLDNRIVAITAAMTLGTGLVEFSRLFPDRFYDVGIAEQHAVTFAGGLAKENLRPVVAVYSTFLQRAYDQVFHDVCLQDLPVIFALDRGGLVGADGPTHHGVFDFSFLRHLPGMVIIAPRNENELRRCMFAAISFNKPVAVRYPRGSGIGVEIEKIPKLLKLGEGEILRRGDDVTVLAVGPLVYEALKAAEQLKPLNISVEVIDARFIKPLDTRLIKESVRKTGRLITLEENAIAGGFGSAVLETLSGEEISMDQIDLMGIPDRFISIGSHRELQEEIGLTSGELIRRIKLLMAQHHKPLVGTPEDVKSSPHGFNTRRHINRSAGKG